MLGNTQPKKKNHFERVKLKKKSIKIYMYILILVSLLKNYAEIIGAGRVGPCDLNRHNSFFPFCCSHVAWGS